MMTASEYEWTDKFGTHWEVRQTRPDGVICSLILTKQAYGWPFHPTRDEARAAVAQAAALKLEA